MRIWLVKFDEALPIDEDRRPYRMGMLAAALVRRGHEVEWWASTFNHALRKERFTEDTEVEVSVGYHLKLLHTPGGSGRAVSVGRVLKNTRQAVRFLRLASRARRPDAIVCAMPTPELAWVSTRLATRFRIPCILDARDMWPDVFSDLLGWEKRIVSWPYVAGMRMVLRHAARAATCCTSITDPFLNWILRYAGRPVSPTDAVFPLGYREQTYSEEDLARACVTLPPDIPGAFNVVFLGRLNRTVDDAFGDVVTAVERLRCERRDFRFYFAGAGDYAERLQERSRHLPEICYVGHVGAPALAVLKRRAQAALLCIARRRDYQISLSNKVFEYLAAGLPIISHLSGLVGELTRVSGCGIVYDDAAGLATALKLLAEDEDLRTRMGQNARAVFHARYEAGIVYDQMVRHVESVVEGFWSGGDRDLSRVV